MNIKQSISEENVTIGMWSSGLINIETIIFLPTEKLTVEILEQIHSDCPIHNCEDKNMCLGHCNDNEIMSAYRRYIWIAT